MYGLSQPKPQVSQALSLPAPVGGINDLDPLAAMEPAFMLDSMNFFPDTDALKIRNGYREWVTGLVNPVKSIFSYNATDGSFKGFAATDVGVFSIDVSANAPASVLAVTNGLFSDTNFSTTGAQYLIICNGAATYHYNGTAWTKWTLVTTPAAPGEIKGVSPDTFVFVTVHKARLWFLTAGSMTAWYLDPDAVGGTAHPFYLGGIFRRGGYLVSIIRWSMDTGDGLDDRLLFITSTGEVASYSGNDPANAADWNLDSVYFIGPPLGPRAVADFGGDVLYLSRRGLVPLSTLVQGTATDILYSNVLSRRISRTVIALTAPTPPQHPVEVGFHAELALIAINIYDTKAQKNIQLVLNYLNGAWGKFDYPARTIRSVDRNIFMGTDDGRVLQVTLGQYTDNVARTDIVGGVPIEGYAFSAYSFFNDPTSNKHAKFMRPVFQTEVKPSFKMRALPDFRTDPFTLTPSPGLSIGNAFWDLSFWDLANWAGYENVYRPWVSANVLGYAFAWQLRVSTSSFLSVAAVEWVFESGGLI